MDFDWFEEIFMAFKELYGSFKELKEFQWISKDIKVFVTMLLNFKGFKEKNF